MTKVCLFLSVLILSAMRPAMAAEVPDTWSEAAIQQFEAATEAGKKVPYPWPLTAAETFKKAAESAELDVTKLVYLSSLTDGGAKPVCECADALRLLYTIKINNPAAFKGDFSLFQDNFPNSAYAVYMQPQKMLKECPDCNGSPVTLPPCRFCQNTRKCRTCDGSGLEPLRAAWDMRHSKTSNNRLQHDSKRLGGSDLTLDRGNPRRIKRSATPEEVKRAPCPKCNGTGKCPVCMLAGKRRVCKRCDGMGVVPDEERLTAAVRNAGRRGLAALRGVDKAYTQPWEATQKVQERLEALRGETNADVLNRSLSALMLQYPECAQKTDCDRLAYTFGTVLEAQRKAIAENEARAKAIKNDVEHLDRDLRAARRLESPYRRREALADLKHAYPLATDRSALTAAVGDCETLIETQESMTREALEALRSLENPDLGLRRCGELLRRTDSESPFLQQIRDLETDFGAMKARQARIRTIAIGAGIAVALILLYAVFSGLRAANERKKQRARNRRPIPNRFPTIKD